MKQKKTPKSEAAPVTHKPGDWIADRQAAHLAAFQEVRRMTPAELSHLLIQAAADFADRAGDLTDHDGAFPDLMREAVCLYVAGIVGKLPAGKQTDINKLSELNLINELSKRTCAFVTIGHRDIVDQWKINQDADGTNEPAPTKKETEAALILVQRYLEKTVYENDPSFEWGPASDACKLIRNWRKNKAAKLPAGKKGDRK